MFEYGYSYSYTLFFCCVQYSNTTFLKTKIMRAIIEKKTEIIASYQSVIDLNGYSKDFFRIPVFYTRRFLTIPADVPKSEISEELHSALDRFQIR